MMPRQIKNPIYISDLDGTLLRNDETLSDYSRTKLTLILEKGVNFTIATARSRASTLPILGSLPMRLPIIEINGAFITDYHTGRHIVINHISPDIVPVVYQAIRTEQCMPLVTTFDGHEDHLYCGDIINDGMLWYFNNRRQNNDTRLRTIGSITDAFSETVVSFNVIGHYQQVKNLAQRLEQLLPGRLENFFFENFYSPGWWWLTIHDIGACKSKAVKTLLDYTGFGMEQLVVFGDSLNDVKLFMTAPRCIAVANASDQIKSLAHEVIGSNQEDSVVKYAIADSGCGLTA